MRDQGNAARGRRRQVERALEGSGRAVDPLALRRSAHA
jgi:hypothetical protein